MQGVLILKKKITPDAVQRNSEYHSDYNNQTQLDQEESIGFINFAWEGGPTLQISQTYKIADMQPAA